MRASRVRRARASDARVTRRGSVSWRFCSGFRGIVVASSVMLTVDVSMIQLLRLLCAVLTIHIAELLMCNCFRLGTRSRRR